MTGLPLRPEGKSYRHTQIGYWVIALLGGALAFAVAPALAGSRWDLLVVLLVLGWRSCRSPG